VGKSAYFEPICLFLHSLLYYHIVDLDTHNSHHSSNIIFSKEERNEYIKQYKSSFSKNNEIDIAARSIFQTVGIIKIGIWLT